MQIISGFCVAQDVAIYMRDSVVDSVIDLRLPWPSWQVKASSCSAMAGARDLSYTQDLGSRPYQGWT